MGVEGVGRMEAAGRVGVSVFGGLVGAGRNERRSRGKGGAREEEEEEEEEEEKMTTTMKQSQNVKIPYFSVATSDRNNV
jgi:hypothetical protein